MCPWAYTDVSLKTINKLKLYGRTIRFLKATQIYHRIKYKIRPYQHVGNDVPPKFRQIKHHWPSYRPPELSDNLTATFLNQSRDITSVEIWNTPNISKLWLYKLHYFDDLDCENSSDREALHTQLIDRWIMENPPCHGNGWEPYPISLRVVNWCKFFSKLDKVPPAWIESLRDQAKCLQHTLEYHILANHLFANAKALVFLAAHGFDELLEPSIKLMTAELNEQFLDDGGHYERSPMYHNILLWDMLELLQLSNLHVPLNPLSVPLKARIKPALKWAKTMSHNDSQPTLFNDAYLYNAPDLTNINAFANELGFDTSPNSSTQNLANSGYYRRDQGQCSLWMNAAPVGPDYQPGHTHADTLSFEMSIDHHRIFTNSGTSDYNMSTLREHERSTRAHNTVEINGNDSSEVWAAFRVGRRGNVSINAVSEETVSATHYGYQYIGCEHSRTWTLKDSSLTIMDDVGGPTLDIVSRFYLHPTCSAIQTTARDIEINAPSGRVITIHTNSGQFVIINTKWGGEFNKQSDNLCLELRPDSPHWSTTITW